MKDETIMRLLIKVIIFKSKDSYNYALNGFWLTLNKWKLVDIFEELLKSIPINMDEDK